MGYDTDTLKDAMKSVKKGDSPGHPFRGNQYSSGEGGGEGKSSETKPKVGDRATPEQRAQDTANNQIEDWATEFSEKKNSALDMWMSLDQKRQLKAIVDKGGSVKARAFENRSASEGEHNEKVKSLTTKMREYGYKRFADEYNGSSGEVVFVKPKGA